MSCINIQIDIDPENKDGSVIPIKVTGPRDDRTLSYVQSLDTVEKLKSKELECKDMYALNGQLREENGRLLEKIELLKKGRDDRQKERDKEREKVRKLRDELAKSRAESLPSDDLEHDLKAATLAEFNRLKERLSESDSFYRSVRAIVQHSGSSAERTLELLKDMFRDEDTCEASTYDMQINAETPDEYGLVPVRGFRRMGFRRTSRT